MLSSSTNTVDIQWLLCRARKHHEALATAYHFWIDEGMAKLSKFVRVEAGYDTRSEKCQCKKKKTSATKFMFSVFLASPVAQTQWLCNTCLYIATGRNIINNNNNKFAWRATDEMPFTEHFYFTIPFPSHSFRRTLDTFVCTLCVPISTACIFWCGWPCATKGKDCTPKPTRFAWWGKGRVSSS